ncbi:MAG TPA: hypothetical protein PLM20_10680 [Syntrophomonadaceae bacterium]|nr:hypothetical protein [Syntrophomonadaceae bacterium]
MAIPWRKLRIPGIALLLIIVAVAAVLLIPRKSGDTLARCQELYDKRDYAACSRILTKELAKSPDWHEGRKLLVKAQFADNDLLGALSNYLYLSEAGDRSMKRTILDKLAAAEKDIQRQARELIGKKLSENADLDTTREFAAEFELAVENLPGALSHLQILSSRGKPSRELESRAARLCSSYAQWEKLLNELKDPPLSWVQGMKLLFALEHEDIELAGKALAEIEDISIIPEDITAKTYDLGLNRGLAVALDLALKAHNSSWVEEVLAKLELMEADEIKSQLPALLTLLPEEPRLLVLSAFYLLPPSQGLDLLVELENNGYEPEGDYYVYVSGKLDLLSQVKDFDPKYMRFVFDAPVETAWDNLVMTYMKSNPKGLLALADFVEEHGRKADAEMMRTVANYSSPLPKVIWQRPGVDPSNLRLSPDGKWLICTFISESSSEILVVNLRTGEETSFDTSYDFVSHYWHWSRDSKQTAASVLQGQDSVALIISTAGGKVQRPRELPVPADSEILGWMDNTNLALKVYGRGEELYTQFKVAKVNSETGKEQWLSEFRDDLPTINHAGELVWMTNEENGIGFNWGNKKKAFATDFHDPELWDWFPDNKKVIISDNGAVNILDLDTGKYSYRLMLDIVSPGGWADNSSIWHPYYFTFMGRSSPLVKSNLLTGKSVYSGIILPFGTPYVCCAGNIVAAACAGDFGIQVYQMP